jgi:hypothetical protein
LVESHKPLDGALSRTLCVGALLDDRPTVFLLS